MKRIILTLLCVLTVAIVACGCGSTENNQATQVSEEVFTNDDWSIVASDPGAHKGAVVDLKAKVFIKPERDDKGTYLQVWADPVKNDWNTLVAISDPNLDVDDGNFIHIKGTVKDEFEGENAFGAKISAPVIAADAISKVDAKEVLAPTV